MAPPKTAYRKVAETLIFLFLKGLKAPWIFYSSWLISGDVKTASSMIAPVITFYLDCFLVQKRPLVSNFQIFFLFQVTIKNWAIWGRGSGVRDQAWDLGSPCSMRMKLGAPVSFEQAARSQDRYLHSQASP